MKQDIFLRDQIVHFLEGNQSHMSFRDAIKDFPFEHINDVFPHGKYTFWHLLEHIRRTEHDILDFMTNRDYKEPEWPKDYWPAREKMATEKDWKHTIQGFTFDATQLIALVRNPDMDLAAKVPNGTGQIYLREFMLVIDHNSYHMGEFAIMRQVFAIW